MLIRVSFLLITSTCTYHKCTYTWVILFVTSSLHFQQHVNDLTIFPHFPPPVRTRPHGWDLKVHQSIFSHCTLYLSSFFFFNLFSLILGPKLRCKYCKESCSRNHSYHPHKKLVVNFLDDHKLPFFYLFFPKGHTHSRPLILVIIKHCLLQPPTQALTKRGSQQRPACAAI